MSAGNFHAAVEMSTAQRMNASNDQRLAAEKSEMRFVSKCVIKRETPTKFSANRTFELSLNRRNICLVVRLTEASFTSLSLEISTSELESRILL